MRHRWCRMFLGIICVNFFSVFIMWIYLDSKCPCFEASREGAVKVSGPAAQHPRRSYSVPQLEQDDGVGEALRIRNAAPLDDIYDLPNSLITLVLREFEFYEHDLVETVRSFHTVFPRMPIVLFADDVPYPPLRFPRDEFGPNVTVVSLAKGAGRHANATRLEHYLRTDLVLFAPDSVRMTQPAIVTTMIKRIFKNPRNMVAVRVAGEMRRCLNLDVNLREWTLVYRKASRTAESHCDAFGGRHLLMAKTGLVLSLGEPLARPSPEALYIQTALRDVKIEIVDNLVAQNGRTLFTTEHNREKLRAATTTRRTELYVNFGVKKVHQPGGEVTWHGCSRATPRCFPTVVDETPDYLYKDRWTPPCCLENLRRTARHVFAILERCKARYWLEGGSLLGAARNHDIIPWDYDVDIGVYRDDVQSCEWLRNSQKGSVIDTGGFMWEKATEGDFIRVQYSRVNRVHVDIFPFYSRNGVMTKDTWFKSHPQDREFPEHFLKPLTTILFAGVFASAPNNITQFLELKFGKGVVEKPQYPNPALLAYPKSSGA
ncbi:ribitol 5-phosphate transferase FKRP [Amblyomma americanum]|uniref:Fukutin-related protein n=1 Tax=Amblyomma americanum TaxID=6943 RepID=A0AAQ4EPZ8_AMBAM